MSDALTTDVGGRKRAPLTLEQAVYLRPVQAAVLAVIEHNPAVAGPADAVAEGAWERATRCWRRAPAQMTRLHSALPLAEDRAFSLLELIDFYLSEEHENDQD